MISPGFGTAGRASTSTVSTRAKKTGVATKLDTVIAVGVRSAATITRLTTLWQDEARLFADHSLSDVDYVYLWVDGIHVNVCLEQERLCLLVMIGVRTDGKKELIALTDGYRESTESWAGLLRDAKRCGMRAPVLAMCDGALGFWAAVKDVFPRDEGAALLVTQVGECLCCATENRHTRWRSGRCRISTTPRTRQTVVWS